MEEKQPATDLEKPKVPEEDTVSHNHDPHGGEKGALMGGIGGALTGIAAGSLAGPAGAVIGGTMGAVAGSLAAAAVVSVADDYEKDPTQGIENVNEGKPIDSSGTA